MQQMDETESRQSDHSLSILPLFKSAWMKTSTPANAESAFHSTGIYPLNADIFPVSAFDTSETTEGTRLSMDSVAAMELRHQSVADNEAEPDAGPSGLTVAQANETACDEAPAVADNEPMAGPCVLTAAQALNTDSVLDAVPSVTDNEPIAGLSGLTVAPSTSVSFNELKPVPQATNRQHKPNVQSRKRKSGGRLLNSESSEMEKKQEEEQQFEKAKLDRKRSAKRRKKKYEKQEETEGGAQYHCGISGRERWSQKRKTERKSPVKVHHTEAVETSS